MIHLTLFNRSIVLAKIAINKLFKFLQAYISIFVEIYNTQEFHDFIFFDFPSSVR